LWEDIEPPFNFIPTGADFPAEEDRYVLLFRRDPDTQAKIQGDPNTRGPLLTTRWGPEYEYAHYTPGNTRLSSWSVGVAQMIAHAQLQPTGNQRYSGSYHDIDVRYSPINYSHVTNALSIANVPATGRRIPCPRIYFCSETAMHMYFVATVLQQDFGASGHMGNTDVWRAELADHYQCSTGRYKTTIHSRNDIQSTIISEIESNRPLLLYIMGTGDYWSGYARAVVVDGYNNTLDGTFYVHLNCGNYGNDTGWYSFWDEINASVGVFNDPYRWVMTLRPE
jgi:hypothetical protein